MSVSYFFSESYLYLTLVLKILEMGRCFLINPNLKKKLKRKKQKNEPLVSKSGWQLRRQSGVSLIPGTQDQEAGYCVTGLIILFVVEHELWNFGLGKQLNVLCEVGANGSY